MTKVLEVLSKYIEIVQCENNKKIFLSKECPFCGEKGRRVFRYNCKIKVGKFYCCGISFKELYWLEKQLEDKDYAEKFQLENKHGFYKNMSVEKWEKYKNIKDKLSIKNSGFEKSDEDLPF
jgi:hypothetical protein